MAAKLWARAGSVSASSKADEMFDEAQRLMRRMASSEGFSADPITREKLHVSTLNYRAGR